MHFESSQRFALRSSVLNSHFHFAFRFSFHFVYLHCLLYENGARECLAESFDQMFKSL